MVVESNIHGKTQATETGTLEVGTSFTVHLWLPKYGIV
jgi:hypothetical protein